MHAEVFRCHNVCNLLLNGLGKMYAFVCQQENISESNRISHKIPNFTLFVFLFHQRSVKTRYRGRNKSVVH